MINFSPKNCYRYFLFATLVMVVIDGRLLINYLLSISDAEQLYTSPWYYFPLMLLLFLMPMLLNMLVYHGIYKAKLNTIQWINAVHTIASIVLWFSIQFMLFAGSKIVNTEAFLAILVILTETFVILQIVAVVLTRVLVRLKTRSYLK